MIKFLNPDEVRGLPLGLTLLFDIEIYRNFFFIAFKIAGKNEVVAFEMGDECEMDLELLAGLVHRHTLVGFNSDNFDMPLLTYALTGASAEEIKKVCDKIINDGLRKFDFYKKMELAQLRVTHWDLMPVCPLKAGLKLYGARLHARSIQDLPVDPSRYLTREEKNKVGMYCVNDLQLTELLMTNLEKQLQLRKVMSEQYSTDLMSCSDAQIAEKVMRSEISKTGGRVEESRVCPGDRFQYEAPDWVCFCTEPLKQLLSDILEADFAVNEKGYPDLPTTLVGRSVEIANSVYKIGIGGLHSSEKNQFVKAVEGGHLVDVDVASYYPELILKNKFTPEHLGDRYLEPYQALVTRRLEAKRAGNKDVSDSLKIVVNGSFGKAGSKWSVLYSPKMLIQVTLTGQIALLMLIECVNQYGIQVVSANTDGVVFNLKDDAELELLRSIVSKWAVHTKLETEETFYSALYSRDVNNYIAIKKDPGEEAKTKGAYLIPEGIFRFHKNPDCNIVSRAVCDYLKTGVDIKDTIESCKDITEFLIVRTVKGGAEFTGEKLGKAVRWYYSRYSKDAITYVMSGNKVPRSEGAQPIQELPSEFPGDADLEKYIEQANEQLYLLGAKIKLTKQSPLFTQTEFDMLMAM